MEKRIGEIITLSSGEKVEVIERGDCEGCFFAGDSRKCTKTDNIRDVVGACGRATRSDDTAVIFKLKKETDMEYKFKVGDLVRIVHCGFGCGETDLGKETTIVELGQYSGPGYKINPPYSTNSASGYFDGFCGEKSFELVKSALTHKFKVGDQVKIVKYGSGCGSDDVGKISTIMALGKYGVGPGYVINPPYNTNSKTGACYYMCGENSFELSTLPKFSTDPDFSIGDWAEIMNLNRLDGGEYSGVIGHQGEIYQIDDSDGMIHLKPYCIGGCWKAHNLKKIPNPNVTSTHGCIHYAMPVEVSTGLSRLKSEEIKPIFISVPKI